MALLFSRSRPGRSVAWFGAAVIALLWGAIIWEMNSERTRIIEAAKADTANLARAFEEHFLRMVVGLDQTLLYLKAEYERAPDSFSLDASVANAAILDRVSVQIARIGADGILADSNVPHGTGIDLSDREHFRVHRDGGATLFVSKPVLGRASGKWSIQLTRRLERRDGRFAGVMVISLDPHYLADFYGSFDIGGNGRVMLVGRDGVVRADSAASAGLGETLAQPLLGPLFSAGTVSTSLPGPIDGVKRITSFRAIAGLPMGLLVGRSEAEVLAPHGEAELVYLLVGGALSVVLGGASAVLFHLVHRQELIAGALTVKKSELVESRERLKRYVADLERIAEVSAHDLQEPLRRVVSYTQLLSKCAGSVLDDEGRGYVAQVVEDAHRISTLVRDLEAFVAVDHLPPVLDLVGADEAVAIAVKRHAADLEACGATLVVDSLPKVAADARSLTEIFAQLLENALRYRSPDRKPIVHVSARREPGHAAFFVRDNGRGIEPRHWGRIFEVFHRLPGGGHNPGTGMGLTLVRRMVERLGGRIWLDSAPGEGSTFWFTVPTTVGATEDRTLDQEAHAA